jgi:hypothetical protein
MTCPSTTLVSLPLGRVVLVDVDEVVDDVVNVVEVVLVVDEDSVTLVEVDEVLVVVVDVDVVELSSEMITSKELGRLSKSVEIARTIPPNPSPAGL